MPFKSKAQRGFLYAKHPDVAAKFQKETPKGKELPEHAGKNEKTRHQLKALRRMMK